MDDIAYIPLTRDQFALIDASDFVWLSQYNWQCIKGWKEGIYYAKTDFGPRAILMHRLILDIHEKPGAIRGDHIDCNGLNNRRKNLRILSASMNNFNTLGLHKHNTSGIKGVYWSTQKQKWHAELLYQGKKHHLGFFTDINAAAAARKRKENELWRRIQSPQT